MRNEEWWWRRTKFKSAAIFKFTLLMLFENIFIPAYFLFHFYEGNPRKTGKEYIFTLSQQTIIRNTSDKLYLKFAALYELCAAT
ncbi:hypothetical protein [uncultured Dialister sp.]|uniref:hypothetical protein n=1 Tax=uncultured Dialister sp. TaxID=278064 RepID=UPI0025F7C93B|nr:hypothetical protein [uncultured Dialister sp.]